MLIDLHCHTKDHSFDGKVSAADMIHGAVKAGFGGIVFTDHAYCWPHEELAELRAGLTLPADFFLASGQEVNLEQKGVTLGDLLIFGLDRSLPDGTDALEAFRLIREQKAFCIAPHPTVTGRGLGNHVESFPVDALEVWNGRYREAHARNAEALATRLAMPVTGGSDAHRPEDIGGGATIFPRRPRDLADIGIMIRAGETKAWRPGLWNSITRMAGL